MIRAMFKIWVAKWRMKRMNHFTHRAQVNFAKAQKVAKRIKG